MTSICGSEQGTYICRYCPKLCMEYNFQLAWEAFVESEEKATEYPWVYWGRLRISPQSKLCNSLHFVHGYIMICIILYF